MISNNKKTSLNFRSICLKRSKIRNLKIILFHHKQKKGKGHDELSKKQKKLKSKWKQKIKKKRKMMQIISFDNYQFQIIKNIKKKKLHFIIILKKIKKEKS